MNQYFERIRNKFIDNVIMGGFNASREDIVAVIDDMKPVVIESGNDPEQIVEKLLGEVNSEVGKLMQAFPIPGYNIAINSGNINAITYGGYMDENERPMIKDAIFDIASITKLFTQVISYNLIKEGYYNFDSKIADLDPEFKNAGDLDIKTLMEFAFVYKMDGDIRESNSVEESKSILHTISPVEKKYHYSDAIMILKEVMEKVTGMSFEQLVDKYIVNKLGLKNTFLIVPEDKRDSLTGTPNAKLGINNDMNAVKLGGFSSHAGIHSTGTDLHEVVRNLYINKDFFPSEYLPHVYTESDWSKNAKDREGKPDPWKRGIMGNACTAGGSFVDKLSSSDSSAYQGSTRTQLNVGTINGVLTTSTILLNPASMGLKKARENYGKQLREYKFEGKDYAQISGQAILTTGGVVKPLTNAMARLSLKLSFLNAYMHEDGYNKKVNIEMENKELKKVA